MLCGENLVLYGWVGTVGCLNSGPMEVALSSVPGPYGIYRKISRGDKNV